MASSRFLRRTVSLLYASILLGGCGRTFVADDSEALSLKGRTELIKVLIPPRRLPSLRHSKPPARVLAVSCVATGCDGVERRDRASRLILAAMKFRVMALDFDGTIARDGKLNPDVRSAIVDARSQGVVVVLVTGRNTPDLQQAAVNLDFLDAVVAENGAVISSPRSLQVLGGPPPQNFLDELRRRGIPISMGQCVVEAGADSAPQILAVIRDLELPLLLLFNRSRLMVLPQGVSKGAGLRAALSALRLSVHNAVGIGDAENAGVDGADPGPADPPDPRSRGRDARRGLPAPARS